MDKVYQHLVEVEGESNAKNIVHQLYCEMNLGKKFKFSVEMMDDLVQGLVYGLPYMGIEPGIKDKVKAFRAVIDELTYMTMNEYKIEDFLKEFKEEDFDKILIDYEKWDQYHPEHLLLNLRKQLTIDNV
jgi:hypothetical protein